MTSLTIKPYTPSDLEGVLPAHGQAFELNALSRFQPKGPSFTFRRWSTIVAFGGFEPCSPLNHVAEAWSVITRDAQRADYARLMAHARLLIDIYVNVYQWTRIEATARCDLTGAGATLERIGFSFEAERRGAGPYGVDVQSFAILRKAQ